MFVAALFMTDKKYKQPKCLPIDEMDIQNLVQPLNGILLSTSERKKY